MSDAPALFVEELLECDADGEIGARMGWWAKGHHDPGLFLLAAVTRQVEDDGEVCAADLDDVRHLHWRNVPVAGNPGAMRFVETTAGGRGAYPVTVLERRHGWAGVMCTVRGCVEPGAPMVWPLTVGDDAEVLTFDVRPCNAHVEAYERLRLGRTLHLVRAGDQ